MNATEPVSTISADGNIDTIPTISSPTQLDNEMFEKGARLKEAYLTALIKYRAIWCENPINDYPLFLYLASILNFIESHNGGCLSESGMKSLELDVSRYIIQLKEETTLGQKDYVRFCLNLLNSYATCVLFKGMEEYSKEAPEAFFSINEFPSAVREDFDTLSQKCDDLVPKLRQVLDTYTPNLENKYRKIFNEEKNKGFIKPIFDDKPIRLGGKGLPTDLENARECH